MTLPEPFDIVVFRGKPYERVEDHTEDDAGDIPMDLSGESISSHVRADALDDDPAAAFTVDVTRADEGIISYTLTEVQTAVLTENRYRYDSFVDASDECLSRGKVTVMDPVTHD